MKLRALFTNDDEALFPNQFVNARLTVETVRDATLVPNAALLQGTPGTYVYLMDGDNKVTVRPVKTGETDGTRTVVLEGLKPGDHVVTDGTDRLRDGAPVRVTSGAVAQGEMRAGGPGTAGVQPAPAATGTPEGGERRGRRRQAP